MNIAVLQTPGSEHDPVLVQTLREGLGCTVQLLRPEETSLGGVEGVIISGGFGVGETPGRGVLSPSAQVLGAIGAFAEKGGLVLGIGQGFQILCEAGLLPGTLRANRSLAPRRETVFLKAATPNSPFTCKIPDGKLLRLPRLGAEGCYQAEIQILAGLKANNQVLWSYVDAQGHPLPSAAPAGLPNPIAGICNATRNVAGLVPHLERSDEAGPGAEDGCLIFESMLQALRLAHSPNIA